MGITFVASRRAIRQGNSGYRLTQCQLQQAREWLADCVWEEIEPEEFETLSERRIIRGIERHFDGGMQAFLTTCA